MRVAIYYNNNDIRIEEMPKPGINEGELLVKTIASGICGSDVMEWYRIKKAPRVLGHEMSGEIVESKDENYKVGDRVFVSHHVPCNECDYCLNGFHTACETLHRTNFDPGGFSEYIRIPKINVEKGGVYLLPEHVSFEEGTFIEPLACVLRGQRLVGIEKDDTVLVIGSGISGLLHVQLAKLSGAKIFATDINEYRMEMAERFGADFVLNAKEDISKKLIELNNRLADHVIVCAGALSATKQAFRCVDRGGTILFFAVPEPDIRVDIPINDFWRNEVKIMTSYGAGPNDLKEALNLISEGKVNVRDMVTHRLGLEEAGLGFKLVAEAGESLKVIIKPHD